MFKPRASRISVWIAGVALVAAFASAVPATITDDVNPMDSKVLVGLWNPGAYVSVGTVSVTATMANGQTATRSVPFRVDAQGRTRVFVTFPATVSSIGAVEIIEDPDPIP